MSRRLVVVGGDAAGMSAATNALRRRSDLEVVALEKGDWTSYSACGIPFVVGGEVDGIDTLVARSPEEHRAAGIDVRVRHEAMAIDLDRREVEVRDHDAGSTSAVGFDDLVIATGARPLRPDVPGVDGGHVHGVQTLDDAAHLLDHVAHDDIRRVVVAGGGYIGLEMAEAFINRGASVVVVERAGEVMSTLDPELGALVSDAMRRKGIDVRTATSVEGFEPGVVHTTSGDVPCDLVVLGLGVVANSELGEAAGLATGPKGALLVDDRQRTAVDGVWSAGDCAAVEHRVLHKPVHLALGTIANRTGRVAGINIGGGDARFPGALGTAVTKLCSTEVARTGVGEHEAGREGLDVVAAVVRSGTRAHYYPGSGRIDVKLVADRATGRLVGGQIVGSEGAAKRIDVVATAIAAGLTLAELADVDLSYAPPFSPVWDPVSIAARVVEERRRSAAGSS